MLRPHANVTPREMDGAGSGSALPAPPATSAQPALPLAALRCAAQGALIESRQRWRDLVGLAADLSFETDAEGRLAFLGPEEVLGWPATALLGRHPAEEGLLLHPEPDPFALRGPARDLRTWMRRRDGEAACLSFTVVPLRGPDGGFLGLRGVARDITGEILEAEAQAAALRRALAVEALVRRVREAVLAPRMLPALLDLLPAAIGCAGATLVDVGPDGLPLPGQPERVDALGGHHAPPRLGLHAGRRGEGQGTANRLAALRPPPGQPLFTRGLGGEPVALVPQHRAGSGGLQPLGAGGAAQSLLVWREAGARPFDADERHLLEALSDLLGVVLGNQRLLAELERQARTEALTGLLNRGAFLDELRRRLDRLQREGRGGTLLFLDVDNLKPVNDRFGHEMGDALLVGVATLMRRSTRPTDLAARLGGDEFALWLDGVTNEDVARARAEALCTGARGILLTPPGEEERLAVSISLGAAVTQPGAAAEAPENLLARADAALYAAKRAGRNAWRLAPAAGAVA